MEKKWFELKGQDGDIAVSTRIRLARDIEKIPFGCHMSVADADRVISLCSSPILENAVTAGRFRLIPMESLPDAEMMSLVERHLISPEFAKSTMKRALLLSNDEGISVMLNEEDHIRLQVLGQGFCLEDCLASAVKLDTLIDEGLSAKGARYAFDENLGYLTHCPTNLGTGLRASVMLHLPVLAETGKMTPLIQTAGKLGLAVRGYYGEGSRERGNLYQISNRLTLGYAEEELTQNLKDIVSQIIKEERASLEALKKSDYYRLADRVCRAEAILKSARMIDTAEAMALLSDYRLGITAGILTGDMEKVNAILERIQPATLMQHYKDAALPVERDAARAELIRESLNGKDE